MKCSVRRSIVSLGALLLLGVSSSIAFAQPLFFDDFEDRVADQPTIGNNWTWYNQWFEGDTCGENYAGGFGPYDDGDGGIDYVQDNHNYANEGDDGYYSRAGLEVPAWDGALSNMLRVYGNPDIEFDSGYCQRVLIFQEIRLAEEHVGSMMFSFDVAKAQNGAPQNGEITAGFVKVIKTTDGSYEELVFEHAETLLPDNMLTDTVYIEFEVTEEHVGELLQFGFYNDVVEDLGQSWATAAAQYDNVTLDFASIGPAHSGSFYNKDQDGHGFSVEFGNPGGEPYAVIYWYIYDDEGNPIFMVGLGEPVGNRVEVTFYSPYGMKYGEFLPSSIPDPKDVGGTGVFVFSSTDTATFSYTPSQFSQDTWGHTTPIVDLPLIKLFDVPAEPVFPTTE
jgi:hypothetical protein